MKYYNLIRDWEYTCVGVGDETFLGYVQCLDELDGYDSDDDEGIDDLVEKLEDTAVQILPTGATVAGTIYINIQDSCGGSHTSISVDTKKPDRAQRRYLRCCELEPLRDDLVKKLSAHYLPVGSVTVSDPHLVGDYPYISVSVAENPSSTPTTVHFCTDGELYVEMWYVEGGSIDELLPIINLILYKFNQKMELLDRKRSDDCRSGSG